MTEAEIWEWQCSMHLWSCYLYEVEDNAPLPDPSYDNLCRFLLQRYETLPAWYRKRVKRSELESGTGARIARTLDDAEKRKARWWRDVHIPKMHSDSRAREKRLQRAALFDEFG